tara:strand:- start:3614 stop:3754 length:141 start_codon:yes stop_codon:yes gene_type:complete
MFTVIWKKDGDYKTKDFQSEGLAYLFAKNVPYYEGGVDGPVLVRVK